MTTFTMQDLNKIPVTKEEEEAMQALGRPLLDITPTTQDILNNLAIPQAQLSPEAIIDEMVSQFSIKLKLLLTVINQTKAQPHAEDQSLQECVSLTLQQGNWVKHMVEEKVQSLFDDKDFEYYAESAVESYFTNSFSLDDHVDITAEVENRIEEIVEEQLADIVSEKLRNLRITFD